MKRALVISGVLLIVVAALPSIKNGLLYFNYHHGRETLSKVEGPPGQLVGMWEGTFDTYQCGMDERHELNLTIHSDSTGSFHYRHLYDRIGVSGGADIYSWPSLLPFDRSQASTYEIGVRVKGDYIIVPPSEDSFSPDTSVIAFEVVNNRMRFAYVRELGEEPKEWGLSFSRLSATPTDLLAFW